MNQTNKLKYLSPLALVLAVTAVAGCEKHTPLYNPPYAQERADQMIMPPSKHPWYKKPTKKYGRDAEVEAANPAPAAASSDAWSMESDYPKSSRY